MLALCLMLLLTYYAQNYAGIIGASLTMLALKGVASYREDKVCTRCLPKPRGLIYTVYIQIFEGCKFCG